ncbi:MAG: hypothetical protein ACTS6A_01995 [Candidatus Hodgkinia cicadicola]
MTAAAAVKTNKTFAAVWTFRTQQLLANRPSNEVNLSASLKLLLTPRWTF